MKRPDGVSARGRERPDGQSAHQDASIWCVMTVCPQEDGNVLTADQHIRTHKGEAS